MRTGALAAARLLAGALALAALAGCGGRGLYWPVIPPDLPPPRVVDDAANGSSVDLVRTQWLLVRLPVAADGYTWSYDVGGDRNLYPSGESPRFEPADGSGRSVIFTFRAEGTGTSSLRFAYRNADAPQMPPARSVAFDVVAR